MFRSPAIYIKTLIEDTQIKGIKSLLIFITEPKKINKPIKILVSKQNFNKSIINFNPSHTKKLKFYNSFLLILIISKKVDFTTKHFSTDDKIKLDK